VVHVLGVDYYAHSEIESIGEPEPSSTASPQKHGGFAEKPRHPEKWIDKASGSVDAQRWRRHGSELSECYAVLARG